MPCIWLFAAQTSPAENAPSEEQRYRRGEVINIINGEDLPPSCSENDTNVFLRYHMTDKTRVEVEDYLSRWNREVVFEVVNGPSPTGFRRVKCSNEKINQSQNIGGWTQEQADEITTTWNADPNLNKLYPAENLVTVGFTAKDLIQEGEFTDQQAAAYQQLVYDAGENYLDKQRIWSLTPEGADSFDETGGVKTGTAQQLEPVLQNGLDT